MLIAEWGLSALPFASRVKSLRGMDIIPEAIEDAKRNAKRMGFANTYEAGEVMHEKRTKTRCA